ncbi:S-layer homology domain-containing protein [Paenibacillus sp. MBLB4367]|uniref:S-layer homology domain-containing protein n=1 Tax=Paenibacillus sp. MBLB4367 TaxID=3384767 RepID=UPI003907F927
MRKPIIMLYLLSILAVFLVPATSSAAPLSIQADRQEAAYGETVKVTGTAPASSWIVLRVLDERQSIVVFDSAKSDADGRYRFAFIVPASASPGKLNVQTGSGTDVSALTIAIKTAGAGSGPEIQPSPAPSQTPAPSPAATVNGGTITIKPALSQTPDGRTVAGMALQSEDLLAALKHSGSITVTADTGSADIAVASVSAQALKQAMSSVKEAKLNLAVSFASYELPLQTLDLDSLAKQLQTTTDKLEIRIKLAKADTKQNADTAGAIAGLGAKQAAEAVDFAVEAVYNGQTVPVVQFGGAYINRTLPMPNVVDPNAATGVMIGPKGSLLFVPSVFKQENGKWTAQLKRTGNSLYTVIENRKSFRDTDSHWAKADVELLASKLIVQGATADTFQPDTGITRAQFTAIIVRALGLSEQSGSSFRDIAAADWYSGAVTAAAEAELVSGYEDGSFRPNAPITREELAVLMSGALRYAGKQGDASRTEQLLTAFQDRGELSAWSRDAVAAIVDAGVTEGKSEGRYEGKAQATRAETAAMVRRFLIKAEFINR